MRRLRNIAYGVLAVTNAVASVCVGIIGCVFFSRIAIDWFRDI